MRRHQECVYALDRFDIGHSRGRPHELLSAADHAAAGAMSTDHQLSTHTSVIRCDVTTSKLIGIKCE